jgi:hypothetical protein
MSFSSSDWRLAQGISLLTGGTILFTVNTVAGVLVLAAMRHRNITFLLIGTMIIVDAIYGLAQMTNGIYSLQLSSNESGTFPKRR